MNDFLDGLLNFITGLLSIIGLVVFCAAALILNSHLARSGVYPF